MSLLELALEIACFSKSQQRAVSLIPCSIQQDPLHSMSWAGIGQLRNFPLPACLHNQRLLARSRRAFPGAALLAAAVPGLSLGSSRPTLVGRIVEHQNSAQIHLVILHHILLQSPTASSCPSCSMSSSALLMCLQTLRCSLQPSWQCSAFYHHPLVVMFCIKHFRAVSHHSELICQL